MRNTVIATLIAGTFLTLDAHAVDLLQVYKEALANDAVYAGARASLAAGEEKITQGRAGLLPTLAISGSSNRSNQDSLAAGVETNRRFDSKGYTLSLSQPIFRWANWEQYQQGKLSVAASEAQFAQAQQDLIVRVSQAYFDVLGAQDALDSVLAQKTAITEQLASAKRNFEVGTATITDTHEAQARFDLAVAQEFAAQSDLEIKRAALQQIIGKPATNLATLRPGLKLSGPQPAQIDKWVDSAVVQNYGVVGQQLTLEIAQREVKKNFSGHLPTVDMVASRSHNNQTGSSVTSTGSISDTNTVSVQWAIPLFSGFSVTSKVRETMALEDKARADLENARRTAAQGARQSYLGVNSGLAQVTALEAAEISSQSALDSNKLGYQVGVRINIDVLNAQQQLYLTRRDLAKARYDTLLNSLRLKSAAGTLKEEDLVQINALLIQGQAGSAAPLKDKAEPAPAAKPAAPAKAAPGAMLERDAVWNAVNGWAQAWSAQDVKNYLDFYGSDFTAANGRPRQAWADERRSRIAGKSRIQVKLESPEITLDGDTATVKFRQIYQSDRLTDNSNKTLVLAKQDGKWKIKQEYTGS